MFIMLELFFVFCSSIFGHRARSLIPVGQSVASKRASLTQDDNELELARNEGGYRVRSLRPDGDIWLRSHNEWDHSLDCVCVWVRRQFIWGTRRISFAAIGKLISWMTSLFFGRLLLLLLLTLLNANSLKYIFVLPFMELCCLWFYWNLCGRTVMGLRAMRSSMRRNDRMWLWCVFVIQRYVLN